MRRRMLLSTLGVALVAILVLGLPLLVVTVRLISDAARNNLLRETQNVQTYVDEQLLEGHSIRPGLDRLVPGDQRVTVRLTSGQVIREGSDPGRHPLRQQVKLRGGGSISIARPIGPVHADQLRAGLLVGVLALVSAAIAAGVAMFSARRLSDPLLDVADRAARLGAGDFRISAGRHGIPELDRVSDVLDHSATRIAELVRRERDLASDVSHQIRSRLTALQMRLEEIALCEDPAVQAEAEAALEQAERLSGVVDELLAQARNASAAEAVALDVSTEVGTILQEYGVALSAAGRKVRDDLPVDLHAMATPGRLHQALAVLLDNAINHGAGVIGVTARETTSNVVVEVTDGGAGVSEELAPRLFERGVSGASGNGLGLALARALVEADGGRLELRQARPPVFAIFLGKPKGKSPVDADPAAVDS